MTSLDEAYRAKIQVRVRLGWPAWLLGVVVEKDFGGSHYVKVTVAELTDEIRGLLPQEVDGVRVVVDVGSVP